MTSFPAPLPLPPFLPRYCALNAIRRIFPEKVIQPLPAQLGSVKVQWGPQTSPRRTCQVHSYNGHTFQLKFHGIFAHHRVPLSSLQLFGDLSQVVGKQQAGFMGCSLCCPAFNVLGHSLPRVPLFYGGRKFRGLHKPKENQVRAKQHPAETKSPHSIGQRPL